MIFPVQKFQLMVNWWLGGVGGLDSPGSPYERDWDS